MAERIYQLNGMRPHTHSSMEYEESDCGAHA